MDNLLNDENDWDSEVDCPEVMGPCCLLLEEKVAADDPTGVVSEIMKPSGGFGTMWMTDLINNIGKEDCIPDDWRKSILVPVHTEI